MLAEQPGIPCCHSSVPLNSIVTLLITTRLAYVEQKPHLKPTVGGPQPHGVAVVGWTGWACSAVGTFRALDVLGAVVGHHGNVVGLLIPIARASTLLSALQANSDCSVKLQQNQASRYSPNVGTEIV